jgi:nucleotide-binding universal stress UspA family protein
MLEVPPILFEMVQHDPTLCLKVPLATDASKEVELAARTAADLADKTSSELHVVHVLDVTSWYLAYSEASGFDGTELEDPALEDLRRISEQRAGELLNAEAEKLRSVGGTPTQMYPREGVVQQETVALAGHYGAGAGDRRQSSLCGPRSA